MRYKYGSKSYWKQRFPLIEAFVEGKVVQYYCENGEWKNIDPNSGGTISLLKNIDYYRIKPKVETVKVYIYLHRATGEIHALTVEQDSYYTLLKTIEVPVEIPNE